MKFNEFEVFGEIDVGQRRSMSPPLAPRIEAMR